MNRMSYLAVGLVSVVFIAVPVFAAKGVAMIKGTAPGSPISGEVTFQDTPAGLEVGAHFVNAPPGKHGFHIHENGTCDEMGKAAGGHYNPTGAPHGLLAKDGAQKAHAGDLGSIEITAEGAGSLEGLLPGVSLSGGQYNVEGRAVILHENPDDFSQPTGNSGGRIACGVIQMTAEKQ